MRQLREQATHQKTPRVRNGDVGAKRRIAGAHVAVRARSVREEGQQVGVELVLVRVGQTVGATRIDL